MAAVDLSPSARRTPRQRRWRLAMALTFAPQVAVPMMCVGSIMRGHEPEFGLSDIGMIAALYLPFAYVGALLVGLPLHLWLRRGGQAAWWAYALGGAGIATSFTLLPGVAGFTTPGDWLALELAGILAGLTFRAIAGPADRAPDRGAPAHGAATSSRP